MTDLKKIGKWIVPATVVSLAVAAILFLGVLELTGEESGSQLAVGEAAEGASASKSSRSSRSSRSRGSRGSRGSRARRARVQAPPPRRAASPRPSSGGVGQPRRAPTAVAPAGREGSASAAEEGAQPAAEESLLARLSQAEDLGARLRVLDGHLARIPAEHAPDELEALLESALPGRFAEAEQLRLGVLSRLGRYDDPRVEAALVRRLDAELPRPQRLLALELLASRPHVGRVSIGAMAVDDHDLVVRKKAAWALQHTP